MNTCIWNIECYFFISWYFLIRNRNCFPLVRSDNPAVFFGFVLLNFLVFFVVFFVLLFFFFVICLVPNVFLDWPLLMDLIDLIFGVLTPLSTIFQLYHGDQFQWWRKPEYPERTTDHGQATGNLYHLRLRVECTLFCKLQSRARTHAVLVIGLYELLDPET